jgi:FtsP/CotA-like multicopper oxidase with cupredoxin domain
MYHSHHDEMTQMQLGMMGLFVVHPKNPSKPPPDRDYAIMLSEWKIEVGSAGPDPNEMTGLQRVHDERPQLSGTQSSWQSGRPVRLRIGNLSTMSHHAIHLHGFTSKSSRPMAAKFPKPGSGPKRPSTADGQHAHRGICRHEPGDWVCTATCSIM